MRVTIQTSLSCLALVSVLVACRAPPPGPPTSGPTPAAGVPAAQGDAGGLTGPGRRYRVAAAESLLQVYAYRGGTLARAGHNHVIASRHLNGGVLLPDDLSQAQFAITVPVALLTIDEPKLRAAAGSEFASEVPDSARDGTRKNMLGEALLDGDRYPGIELRTIAVERTAAGFNARVRVTVKRQESEHVVPLDVAATAERITASGSFKLRQSALGLTPFSVMLGALAVQDELQVTLRVVALAT